MDIGRSSSVGFDHTRLPVRYYRVNLSRVQELPCEADPRSVSFCRDVRGCGATFQTLVEEVPKAGGKLRLLGMAMTGGEYGAESCSKRCARGSMHRPTTHCFKVPRGAKHR
ncbi:hypothetical protein EDB86DRAFT_3079274 [Lactarius hatsudake]|nr:hypothetical protein EDB86DRAFT_3079274 [Lactarius hatsudake]